MAEKRSRAMCRKESHGAHMHARLSTVELAALAADIRNHPRKVHERPSFMRVRVMSQEHSADCIGMFRQL